MDSVRQNKLARLVQKEISDILISKSKELFLGTLITVTVVRVSSDFSLAKIYISIFPTDKTKEILKMINENKKAIRNLLGQKIKNQVRIIPELAFFIDDSLDYANRIDELLKK